MHVNHDTRFTDDNIRLPPQSTEAEQSVLGAFLLSPHIFTQYRDTLTEDDFYRRDHRLIFRAMIDATDNGIGIDAVTLGEYLETRGLSEEIGGSQYLLELTTATPSSSNVSAYVDIVREKRTLRDLIEAGTQIVNDGFDSDGRSAADLYATSLSRIVSLTPRATVSIPPPLDLFDDGAMTTPPLAPDWLPPAIRDFVFQASEVKGSPPDVLFLSCLIALSECCHDGFRLQPKPNEPGWTETARLWGLVVGDASTMKTPVMKLALGPLNDMNNLMAGDHAAAAAKHLREMKIHNEGEKQRTKAAAGGALPEPVEAPKPPPQHRIIVGDVTPEKLADLLNDNPRGLLMFRDEIAGWLGSFGAYSKAGGAKERGFWLESFNGGSYPVDRISRPPIMVVNNSMRILGGIQPDRARALAATMDDDGLLQRFIPIVIASGASAESDAEEPVALTRAYDALLRHLWATAPNGSRTVIAMTPEAITVRKDLMTWLLPLLSADTLPAMLRSHLAKWRGLFPRLCLIYHMVGCGSKGWYPSSKPLSGDTANRVATLMKSWMFPHAMNFYTGIAGHASPVFTLAKNIANLILARSLPRITRREVAMGVTLWRAAPDWQQTQAMALLEQMGWLLPSAVDSGKRAPAWPVNPRVHTEFAARAAQLAAQREHVAVILAEGRSRAGIPPGRGPSRAGGNENAAG
jgi:hypothetical protein